MSVIEECKITFSFRKNWQDFLDTVNEEIISQAGKDIEDWLGSENVRDRSIIDIVCGRCIEIIHRRLFGYIK